MPHATTRKQNAYRDLLRAKTSVTHPRISIGADQVSIAAIQMMQPRCLSRRDKMRAALWEYVSPITWCVIIPVAFAELIYVLRFAWKFIPSIWRFAGSISA